MSTHTPPFVRSPYNYDAAEASLSTGLACLDPSLTIASDAPDADINVIVARYQAGYDIPLGHREGLYGDFTDAPDFRASQDLIRAAKEAFADLPAAVREAFHNDPAALLAAADDPGFEDTFARVFGPPPPAPPATPPAGDPPAN